MREIPLPKSCLASIASNARALAPVLGEDVEKIRLRLHTIIKKTREGNFTYKLEGARRQVLQKAVDSLVESSLADIAEKTGFEISIVRERLLQNFMVAVSSATASRRPVKAVIDALHAQILASPDNLRAVEISVPKPDSLPGTFHNAGGGRRIIRKGNTFS